LPQSPDTVSPSSTDLAAEYSTIYPGRPIRPLPRRRIRARLSVEQAEAIVFPPNPSGSSPLFTPGLSSGDRALHQPYYSGEFDTTSQDDHDHDHDHGHIHEHTCGCTCDRSDLDSEEEEEEEEVVETTKVPAHRYSWPGRMMRLPKQYLDRVTNRSKPPAPNSTTSSADGYESFENTNNKKKRKIPVSSAAMSGFHDSAVAGAQSSDVAASKARRDYPGQYSQPGASGIGITGAGRGRYGRNTGRTVTVNERRPLAPSTNASNTNASASRRDHNSDLGWLNLSTSRQGEVNLLPIASNNQGIISSTIANAAGKGLLRTPKGQENIGLLQRLQEGAPQPQSFTFESEPKLKMSSRPNPLAAGASAQPGQHLPQLSTNEGYTNAPAAQPLASNQTQDAPHIERERTESEIRADQNREYKKAARMRKTAQQAKNRAVGTRPEDRWYCYFCEYEDIFGEPPRALIRQYEMKDARTRREAAEKKRLLDKAKAKGRKLKKGARAARNTAAADGHHTTQPQFYDDQYDPAHPQDHDSQADEFFDDGVDEDLPPTPYPNSGVPSAQFGYPPESVTLTTGPPNGPAG